MGILSFQNTRGYGRDYDEEGKFIAFSKIPSIQVFKELAIEQFLDSIVSWDLKDKEKNIVPINEAVITELVENHQDFVKLLEAEIKLFNMELPDSKKKS